FQAEDGIRDATVTGVQTCALPIYLPAGRVIDPESKLDGVRWIGITGGKVTAVSGTPLQGKAAIEAKGLVVAPGFIDLHAHGQDRSEERRVGKKGRRREGHRETEDK